MARKTRRTSKPRKPARPRVIDLEAEEVKASAAQAGEDAKQAVETAAQDVSEAERNDAEGSEDATSASGDEAPVEAAADSVGDDAAETAETERPEPAGAQAEDGAGDTPEEQPQESAGTASSGGGSGKLIAAGLAALILAGGAGAWLYRTYGPAASGDSAVITQLQQQLEQAQKAAAANAQKVSVLETTIATVKQEADAALQAQQKQAADRQKEASAQLAQMQARIDELNTAISAAAQSGESGTAAQAGTALKVEELTASVAAFGDKLSGLEGKLDAVSQAGGAEAGAVDALKAQVSGLSEALAALKAQQEARATQTVSALGQSFAKLSSAVASGSPFSGELDDLVSVAPTLPGIAELRELSSGGVGSLTSLAGELEQIAAGLAEQKADEAAKKVEEGGIMSALTSQLTKVVKVRKVGETDWGEELKQAAARVAAGDLENAAAGLAAKTDNVPEALAGWQDKAKQKLAAEAALQQLSEAVLRQLAATGTSG